MPIDPERTPSMKEESKEEEEKKKKKEESAEDKEVDEKEELFEKYNVPEPTESFQVSTNITEINPEKLGRQAIKNNKERIEAEKKMIKEQVAAAKEVAERNEALRKLIEKGMKGRLGQIAKERDKASEKFEEVQEKATDFEDYLFVGSPERISEQTLGYFKRKAEKAKDELNQQIEALEAAE